MRIPVGIMFLRKFTFTSLSAAEVLKQPTTISYAPYSLQRDGRVLKWSTTLMIRINKSLLQNKTLWYLLIHTCVFIVTNLVLCFSFYRVFSISDGVVSKIRKSSQEIFWTQQVPTADWLERLSRSLKTTGQTVFRPRFERTLSEHKSREMARNVPE